MTNAIRVTIVGLMGFGVLVLVTTSWAQTRPPIFEKVAKTYGLDSWDKIEAIRYTWNLQLGTLNISRSWEWEPKTTQVWLRTTLTRVSSTITCFCSP